LDRRLATLDLSALLDALDEVRVGLQIIDREHRYAYLNTTAALHGRTTVEALLGRRMEECYPGIDETPMFRSILAALEGTPHTLENRFTYPDGTLGWFELRFEPVASGVLIVSIDVTREREIEHAARHTQRLETMGRIAAGVAHDFNNLLAVMNACATSALSTLPDGHPAASDVAGVLSTVGRGARLTRQLVTFASGAQARPVTLRLDAVVRDLEPLLAKLVARNVTLRVLTASRAHVRVDRSHLEQVLVNLVVNASDAMPDGGALTIETTDIHHDAPYVANRRVTVPAGTYGVVAVTDTGVGINVELQERIFEPFVTTRAEAGGTGLGLATCWGIVRQAGGHLWPHSAPGRGATFRVYLPEHVPAELPAAAPEPPVGGRVLIAVPDPVLHAACVRACRAAGFDVVGAADPIDAVVRGAAEPFDVAVLDLDVVEPSDSLAERLRLSRPSLRVVQLTGYGGVDRISAPHADAVLEKPYVGDRLANTLGRVIRGESASTASHQAG
jgi:two-component system cell cycle sensor histidine kinase/response regulator CckA